MTNKSTYVAPEMELMDLYLEEVIAGSGEGNISGAEQDVYPNLF